MTGIASLTAVSDNTAVLNVDEPVGMSCQYRPVSTGKAVVTLTATANDGSFGPFTITDPCDVDKNAIRSAAIKHGTPTIAG